VKICKHAQHLHVINSTTLQAKKEVVSETSIEVQDKISLF